MLQDSTTIIKVGFVVTIACTGGILLPMYSVQAASVTASSVADQIISTGKQYLGTPYHLGAAAGQTDEFDCSSFAQYIYKQSNIELPRSSREQSQIGTKVSRDQLKPGDLIFSDTNNDGVINHVSIYAGNGQILHTYREGIGVTFSEFADSTWDRTFVTARRLIAGEDPSGKQIVSTLEDYNWFN